MRPSVLDVGSDTQWLVVHVHPGERPSSATSNQFEPRLAGSGGDLAQPAPGARAVSVGGAGGRPRQVPVRRGA